MKIFRLMVLGILSFALVGSSGVRAAAQQEIDVARLSEDLREIKFITAFYSKPSQDQLASLDYLETALGKLDVLPDLKAYVDLLSPFKLFLRRTRMTEAVAAMESYRGGSGFSKAIGTISGSENLVGFLRVGVSEGLLARFFEELHNARIYTQEALDALNLGDGWSLERVFTRSLEEFSRYKSQGDVDRDILVYAQFIVFFQTFLQSNSESKAEARRVLTGLEADGSVRSVAIKIALLAAGYNPADFLADVQEYLVARELEGSIFNLSFNAHGIYSENRALAYADNDIFAYYFKNLTSLGTRVEIRRSSQGVVNYNLRLFNMRLLAQNLQARLEGAEAQMKLAAERRQQEERAQMERIQWLDKQERERLARESENRRIEALRREEEAARLQQQQQLLSIQAMKADLQSYAVMQYKNFLQRLISIQDICNASGNTVEYTQLYSYLQPYAHGMNWAPYVANVVDQVTQQKAKSVIDQFILQEGPKIDALQQKALADKALMDAEALQRTRAEQERRELEMAFAQCIANLRQSCARSLASVESLKAGLTEDDQDLFGLCTAIQEELKKYKNEWDQSMADVGVTAIGDLEFVGDATFFPGINQEIAELTQEVSRRNAQRLEDARRAAEEARNAEIRRKAAEEAERLEAEQRRIREEEIFRQQEVARLEEQRQSALRQFGVVTRVASGVTRWKKRAQNSLAAKRVAEEERLEREAQQRKQEEARLKKEAAAAKRAEMQKNIRRNADATKVQAQVRGFFARKKYERMREEARLEEMRRQQELERQKQAEDAFVVAVPAKKAPVPAPRRQQAFAPVAESFPSLRHADTQHYVPAQQQVLEIDRSDAVNETDAVRARRLAAMQKEQQGIEGRNVAQADALWDKKLQGAQVELDLTGVDRAARVKEDVVQSAQQAGHVRALVEELNSTARLQNLKKKLLRVGEVGKILLVPSVQRALQNLNAAGWASVRQQLEGTGFTLTWATDFDADRVAAAQQELARILQENLK